MSALSDSVMTVFVL